MEIVNRTVNSVDYSDGATPGITNGFDRRGQLVAVTNGATITTRAYNDAGLLLTESYTGGPLDGLSITSTYDDFLRRTNQVNFSGQTQAQAVPRKMNWRTDSFSVTNALMRRKAHLRSD